MAISKHQRLNQCGLECMKIPVSPALRRIRSPPYRRNIRLKHLGTIKDGLLNGPGIVIQLFMLNLDEMVNFHPVQIWLSLAVKVHPVESSNPNGSKGLSRISSKFRVRISAGWWKNDDKGINPKVNLHIYYTWVPLMFRRCPWCKTLRNLVGLVVHETKTGPTRMIPLHLRRPHHNNVKQSCFYLPRQKRLMTDSDNNSAESVR